MLSKILRILVTLGSRFNFLWIPFSPLFFKFHFLCKDSVKWRESLSFTICVKWAHLDYHSGCCLLGNEADHQIYSFVKHIVLSSCFIVTCLVGMTGIRKKKGDQGVGAVLKFWTKKTELQHRDRLRGWYSISTGNWTLPQKNTLSAALFLKGFILFIYNTILQKNFSSLTNHITLDL